MTCWRVQSPYICRRNERKRRGLRLGIRYMTASSRSLAHSHADFGVSPAARLVKRILNQLSERVDGAVDRSRLAALSPRYLDDVGMTVGERAAMLGFEEPARDPWALVTTQRL